MSVTVTSTTTALDRVERAFATLEQVNRPEVWTLVRPQADVEAEALAVDARVAAGERLPLAGTVFAIKDNMDYAGHPTTAAHPAHQVVADRPATVVDLLTAAGSVALGKTNMEQFATGMTGARSPHYGRVASGTMPDRAAGGSSSGSAVAVALGIVDLGLSSDTAGSCRVPAAFNRLVGIKPTLGTVPKDGVLPASESFDCVTILAADAGLARQAIAVMSAPSPLDPTMRRRPADAPVAAPAAPVIGIPRPEDLDVMDGPLRVGYEQALAALVARGIRTTTVDLTPFQVAGRLMYGSGLVAERYAAYGEFLLAHPEGADPIVTAIAEQARDVPAHAYLAARAELDRYKVATSGVWQQCDALLLPTTPVHPTLDDVDADPVGTNTAIGVYSVFANMLDLAAVTVPLGPTPAGEASATVLVPAFADAVALDLAELVLELGAPHNTWRSPCA